MGRIFTVELEGRMYRCRFCNTHLALAQDLISRMPDILVMLNLATQTGSDVKHNSNSNEFEILNECLRELLDGIQEDFYSVVDWACKIDSLCCISMHGITDLYLYTQKADVAGFVRVLLDDLETRISMLFSRVVSLQQFWTKNVASR